METMQAGILAEETVLARYLSFSITSITDIKAALMSLNEIIDCQDTVIGIGKSLARALDKDIDGLTTFPASSAAGIEIPSTPAALWFWLRGNDRGELYHRSRQIELTLQSAFALEDAVDDDLILPCQRSICSGRPSRCNLGCFKPSHSR